MRRRYLITYDICNPKRLRKIFKIMEDFGDHLQLSVFLCELNEVECLKCKEKIRLAINQKEDQVIIVDLGKIQMDNTPTDIIFIGKSFDFKTRAFIV